MTNPILLNEAQVREYYLNQKLSVRKTGELMGVSENCVRSNLIRYNIDMRDMHDSHRGSHPITRFRKGHKTYNFKDIPVDEVVRLYVEENKSCTQIAKIYNVCHKKILKCLNERGIPKKGSEFFNKGKRASNETRALLSSRMVGKSQPQLQTPEAVDKRSKSLRETHKTKSWGWVDVHNRIIKNGGTDAELYLDSLLKNAQVSGYVREYVISRESRARFAVDFAFPEHKIAIELDGDSHKRREEHDKERDAILSLQGWAVRRISNKDLFERAGEIVETIKAMLI